MLNPSVVSGQTVSTPAGSAVLPSAQLGSELVTRVVADVPVVESMPAREQMIVAAWLMGMRSARTRKAYGLDAASWFSWCAARGVDVLAARRVHVDMWIQEQMDVGASPASGRRRLSALSSLYKYCAAHDLVAQIPTDGARRPYVDPDFTKTLGLSRDECRALIAAADIAQGKQQLRNRALIRLLLHNALRVDEACSANIANLSMDKGHTVLTVTRKGKGRQKAALAPATLAALYTYLDHRASLLGLTREELAGPLFATVSNKRLDQSALWNLIRRLARAAEISTWRQLSPHSLRHSAITHFLDAGGTMRDAQDYAGHKDPRTTRRYDRSRHNLDRHGAYTVAAYLAE